MASLPAPGNLDAVKWQSCEVQNQLRDRKLCWKTPSSAIAYQAGKGILLRLFFFFLAGILKSVNSLCRTEAVGGLFFSWLELEHTERAWNLTLPTIPWGGESLLSWWRYWKETKWPVGWPTVCLPRMEEFPQVGTPSANSRTIPGWFFTQKWVKVTQIVVRRSLGLKIMRVSRQQNFKGPSSSMRKPPQKTIHPFV